MYTFHWVFVNIYIGFQNSLDVLTSNTNQLTQDIWDNADIVTIITLQVKDMVHTMNAIQNLIYDVLQRLPQDNGSSRLSVALSEDDMDIEMAHKPREATLVSFTAVQTEEPYLPNIASAAPDITHATAVPANLTLHLPPYTDADLLLHSLPSTEAGIPLHLPPSTDVIANSTLATDKQEDASDVNIAYILSDSPSPTSQLSVVLRLQMIKAIVNSRRFKGSSSDECKS